MREPTVLLRGLGIPESPRWYEGRLWFGNWIDRQVVALAPDGTTEVVPVPVQQPLGYSIGWLPDGRMLVTGDRVRRREHDGTFVVHAEQAANEVVVDGRGTVYVNGGEFDFAAGEASGSVMVVRPDGTVREVAGDIDFPNGMVVTPDNRTLIISESFAGRLTAFDIEPDGGLTNRRVFAEGLGPDGICLDAEGAVWVGTPRFTVARVAEGGKVLQHIELPERRAPFALMLGGADQRTLYILTAEWRAKDGALDNLDRLANGPRTGEVLALPVEVPGAGWP